MDAAALAGLCALLAHGGARGSDVPGVACHVAAPTIAALSTPPAARGGGFNARQVAALVAGDDARDGIARVAYAEAGNQGDSGLAAVVYTILNRLDDGRWGGSVDAVLDAPRQFEPVRRAGGSWRDLRPVSEARRARVDTIVNLALEGRLPDLTNGARFFQNPRIVADRAVAGQVSASLVNFGGTAPSAVIGAHSFYVETGRGGGSRTRSGCAGAGRLAASDARLTAGGGAIFVAENKPLVNDAPASHGDPVSPPPDLSASGPDGPMFVRSDGQGGANWR